MTTDEYQRVTRLRQQRDEETKHAPAHNRKPTATSLADLRRRKRRRRVNAAIRRDLALSGRG
jgi:hypothetical protein